MSFEPVPAFAEAAAALATADDAWVVHCLALGQSAGMAPIRVQRSFSSLLDASDYGRARFSGLHEFEDAEPVDVPLQRLDAILDDELAPLIEQGIHPRVYLKMDTQGFDLEVFRGLGDRGREIIAMQSELALLPVYEQMPMMADALAVYEAAGFEVTGLYPVTRERDGRVIEYDCTMVRAEAFPRARKR